MIKNVEITKAAKVFEAMKYVANISSGLLYYDKESYGQMKPYIVAFTRLFSHDISYEDRYELLKSASVINDKTGDRTRFYLGFGVEAILASLNGKDFETKDRLYSFKPLKDIQIGQTIHLENGVNKDFYIKPRVTGDFTIKKIGRNTYATTSYRKYVESFDTKEELFTLQLKVKDGEAVKTAGLINKFKSDLVIENEYLINNSSGKKVAKLWLPSKKDSLIHQTIEGRKIDIDYIESYTTKGNKKKMEFVAIFGRFVK